MSFTQFLLVMRARWVVAVGLFGTVVVLGSLYFLLQPNLYTGSASVVVQSRIDPVAGVVTSTQLMSSYIATQVDIIGSKRVAERAVKILKLDKDPEFVKQWREATDGQGDIVLWWANKLQKRLSVTPSRDSSVIDISVEWTDKHSAAVFANAFAQAYIDTTIELRVDPAKQYAAYFDERSRALRADLEAKQKKLADFENDHRHRRDRRTVGHRECAIAGTHLAAPHDSSFASRQSVATARSQRRTTILCLKYSRAL